MVAVTWDLLIPLLISGCKKRVRERMQPMLDVQAKTKRRASCSACPTLNVNRASGDVKHHAPAPIIMTVAYCVHDKQSHVNLRHLHSLLIAH